MLEPRHYEAIKMYVRGESLENIAKKMNLTYQAIWKWFTENEEIKAEVEKYQTEQRRVIFSELQKHVVDAIKALVEVMKDKKAANARVQAAKEILDRAGFSVQAQQKLVLASEDNAKLKIEIETLPENEPNAQAREVTEPYEDIPPEEQTADISSVQEQTA